MFGTPGVYSDSPSPHHHLANNNSSVLGSEDSLSYFYILSNYFHRFISLERLIQAHINIVLKGCRGGRRRRHAARAMDTAPSPPIDAAPHTANHFPFTSSIPQACPSSEFRWPRPEAQHVPHPLRLLRYCHAEKSSSMISFEPNGKIQRKKRLGNQRRPIVISSTHIYSKLQRLQAPKESVNYRG